MIHFKNITGFPFSNVSLSLMELAKLLAIAAVRISVFMPPVNNVSLRFSQLPSSGSTTTANNLALRIALYAYASAAWTKASLYLNGRNRRFKSLAYLHLMFGSLILNMPTSKEVKVLPSALYYKMISRLSIYITFPLLIDEIATFSILYFTLLKQSVKGRSAAEGECMICLENVHSGIVICSYNHVAHSKCIGTWYDTNKTCPVCRSEMTVEVHTERHLGWVREEMTNVPKRLLVGFLASWSMSLVYMIKMRMNVSHKNMYS